MTDNQATILESDLPCPQCGYDLRDLPAGRCPECGTAFDPAQLRRLYQAGREAPPVSWILPNMLRHPVQFWRMPQVQFTAGPSPQQVFAILVGILYVSFLVAVAAAVVNGGYAWAPLQAAGTSRPGTAWQMLQTLAWLPPAMAGVWFLLLVHAAMAQVFAPRDAQARAALRCGRHILSPDPVVGYAAAWAAPALASLLALEGHGAAFLSSVVRGADFLLILKSVPWVLAFAAVLFASCAMWAIALYQGGLVVSGGRRWPAAWYAASNPFWLAVLMLAGW